MQGRRKGLPGAMRKLLGGKGCTYCGDGFRLYTFYLFIYIFIYGCVGSSLLCMGFLQLRQGGATLSCGAQASHCGGFSCCRAQALGTWASVVVACRLSSCGLRALECRLSSCGARAELLHGRWDLPRPGIKAVSPALAGRFSTTVPPGKLPQVIHFCENIKSHNFNTCSLLYGDYTSVKLFFFL